MAVWHKATVQLSRHIQRCCAAVQSRGMLHSNGRAQQNADLRTMAAVLKAFSYGTAGRWRKMTHMHVPAGGSGQGQPLLQLDAVTLQTPDGHSTLVQDLSVKVCCCGLPPCLCNVFPNPTQCITVIPLMLPSMYLSVLRRFIAWLRICLHSSLPFRCIERSMVWLSLQLICCLLTPPSTGACDLFHLGRE